MRSQELESDSNLGACTSDGHRESNSILHPMWDEFEFPLPNEGSIAAQYSTMQSVRSCRFFCVTSIEVLDL